MKTKVKVKKKIKKLPYQDDSLYLFIPDKGNLRTIAKDITLLKETKSNPRINEPAVPEVIKSIKAVGFRDPIEVDLNNNIVAGHTRYKAAIELKMKMVPVVVSVYDNEKQKSKYMVLNNKTGEYALWDNEQLIAMKEDFGFTPEELGFTEKEFIKMQPTNEKEMDYIPDKPKKEFSELNKIYLLGKHKLYCMNVLSGLLKLKDESVNTVITSPPYYGLRDYGLPEIKFSNWKGQLGLEPTPEMFIDHLVEIFSEVKRVLRNDGTLWVNIGDSYCSHQAGYPLYRVKTSILKGKQIANKQRMAGKVAGLKQKDRIGIPHMLVFALRKAGWYWRDEIIWHKPSCIPESVKDRCTKNHEFIFMFSKQPKYYYNQELIKEDSIDPESHTGRTQRHLKKLPYKQGFEKINGMLYPTKNKRSVWTITTEPFADVHFAVFPSKLIEPCILAGCPKDGTVLDPFMGAGTTMIVAEAHKRKSIGFELSTEYCDIIRKRFNGFTK